MVRDRRNIPGPSIQNRVGESNRKAISVFGRYLVAKTTSGPILKV
jgi:hypothetical protein